MPRPQDIDEGTWEAAEQANLVVFDASVDLYETGRSATDGQLVIARAIQAAKAEERERCAEEANGVDPAILEGKSERFVSIYCGARVDAANAIRGGA